MPTYEYHCLECKHAFDVYQKITDDPLTLCPVCKKDCLKRGVGGGNISLRFIGSGFYENDYANGCGKCDEGPCSKT